MLASCFETFFGSAPGGAILPSRPARWCGCLGLQLAVKDGPHSGPPKVLVLDGREHGGSCVWV